MKNNECTIFIITEHGSSQIYRKEKNSWTQTSSKGIVRPCTTEQFLSHILPSIAGIVPSIVVVKPDKQKNVAIAALGNHFFFLFLRYFANNYASSLISVSIVCLSPTFISGILMYVSK